MDLFLQPIVDQLVELFTKGVSMQYKEKEVTVKAVLLSAVFDAPARAAVQNFVQFNGYFGCSTCLAKGARFDPYISRDNKSHISI